MANNYPESVVGEVPPGLEVLAELSEKAVRTVQTIGKLVIDALSNEIPVTATSFDTRAEAYANR